MQATVAEQEKIQALLRQARALIQSGRQQITLLRPVWGAYLLGETLGRLAALVEELEQDIGAARREETRDGRQETEKSRNEDREIYL